jgi:sporulation integral membrane protein YlbJ
LAAVSVGMLNNPDIGYLILFPHYLGAICLGFIFRFYKRNKKSSKYKNTGISENIKTSYRQILKEKKPIGSLITGAVKESMDTIFLIGGLVIFYSVAVEILFNMQFVDNILSLFESLLSLNKDFIKGIVSGIFEITMGCKTISSANVSMILKLIGINFVIGWSGLSIHSQVIGFLNKTDLNKGLYIVSKFFHGIISAIFTYILYIWRYDNLTIPSFFDHSNPYNVFVYSSWLNTFFNSIKFAININIIILLVSLIIYCVYNIKELFN